jgi:hypothetical protein
MALLKVSISPALTTQLTIRSRCIRTTCRPRRCWLSDPGINQRLDIWIHMAIEDKDPFSPGWCLWKLDARQVNKKHLLQLVTGLRPAAFREIACDTKAALAASKKATVSWSVSSRPEIAATC